ncbi:TetR/AcrR family transcriptional regulator [Fodinicola feengrottensis]|uniref:TetR/AcrR family transcriptional regulator n=1 Tax=Fodinicola feengrottensis TaxID=435914 RepID=UPI00244188C5|nr:TetR family transcriptional regulator [Fodinicola feengrottensis]
MSADERRQDLVAAAIRVLARDGVAKASTRAIVAEAAMPLGFFHYCFRSKQELFMQVIGTINERNRRAAIDAVRPHRSLPDTFGRACGRTGDWSRRTLASTRSRTS